MLNAGLFSPDYVRCMPEMQHVSCFLARFSRLRQLMRAIVAGGLVDRNRYKGICQERAQSLVRLRHEIVWQSCSWDCEASSLPRLHP